MSVSAPHVARLLAAAWAALALSAPLTYAQTRPQVTLLSVQPKTYLFVGNSFYYYNNSMHSYFLPLVRANEPGAAKELRATSATISGSGFNWHNMDAYFSGGMASYSFVGDNEVVFNDFERRYDAVIMNDCSQCPVHPKLAGLFHEYARKHSDTVRKHGAQPILFMTWAYQDKPEMAAQLAEQYTIAGNANKALVIPAGLAFAKALARKPDLVLHETDKRHPNRFGTYLSAATIYSAIYRKQVAKAPPVAGITADMMQFLHGVAWETVQEYYGAGQ